MDMLGIVSETREKNEARNKYGKSIRDEVKEAKRIICKGTDLSRVVFCVAWNKWQCLRI
jgi:cytidylate kinase